MTKFQKAFIPLKEQEELFSKMLDSWRAKDNPALCDLIDTTDEEEAKVRINSVLSVEAGNNVYKNDTYQVSMRDLGEDFVHLSIKRIDREPIHDWRDLQAIKNELVGEECEGIELYPAESRLVDTANQYHLWVAKKSTFRFPFGFDSKRVVTDQPIGKSKNRQL